MNRLSFALLPALALGFAACRDAQQSVAPATSIESTSSDLARAPIDRLCALTARCVSFSTQPLGPTRLAAGGQGASDASAVIYSNFGPAMSFNKSVGAFNVVGPGSFAFTQSQQFFTPPGTYAFTQAKVALFFLFLPLHVRVTLQADASGRPGAVIETIPLPSPNFFLPAVYTVTSSLNPVLTDSLYWLTVWTPDPADFVHEQFAGWAFNSIGDVSSMNLVFNHGGPDGPWQLGDGMQRSAFEIDGRLVPLHGAIVHQATAGGTVLFGNDRVTYNVTADQKIDGSVSGHLLWIRQSDHFEYRGAVTCLTVVGNRAFVSGDVEQPDATHLAHFAIALEDNGEGSNDPPDRVSALNPSSVAPPCGQRFPVPSTDWTNGNVQIK